MDLELTGKVALITGGSEGIGKASAAEFVREGARVAICARRKDVLEAAAAEIRAAQGGEVLAIPADVSTREGCEAFVQQALIAGVTKISCGAPQDRVWRRRIERRKVEVPRLPGRSRRGDG